VGRAEDEDPMSGGMRSLRERRLSAPLLKGEKWRTPSCFYSAFKKTGVIPLREMLATRRFAVYRDQGSEIALAAFGADSAIEFLSAATITR
jgi:hypothetical protein